MAGNFPISENGLNFLRAQGQSEEQIANIAAATGMQAATLSPPASSVTGAYQCYNMGCTMKAKKKCSACNQARYCTKECQKADWKKRHKAACGKDHSSAQIDPRDMIANLNAGTNGGWYAQKSRKRVYERLWMSFQLRVEDEYTMGGNLVGTYGSRADDLPREHTSREFRESIGVFRRKGLLPPNWTDKDDTSLFEKAEEAIHFALEKSDVIEKFGYSSQEHMVLRSMAESAIGPIGNWVFGDGS